MTTDASFGGDQTAVPQQPESNLRGIINADVKQLFLFHTSDARDMGDVTVIVYQATGVDPRTKIGPLYEFVIVQNSALIDLGPETPDGFENDAPRYYGFYPAPQSVTASNQARFEDRNTAFQIGMRLAEQLDTPEE